jgi:hypothetical protein
MRNALGNTDTGSSGQAIRFLATGSLNRFDFFIESNRIQNNSQQFRGRVQKIRYYLDVFNVFRQKLDIF